MILSECVLASSLGLKMLQAAASPMSALRTTVTSASDHSEVMAMVTKIKSGFELPLV